MIINGFDKPPKQQNSNSKSSHKTNHTKFTSYFKIQGQI